MKTQIQNPNQNPSNKSNRINQFFSKVIEEGGAWLMAGGFFYCILWVTGIFF